MSSSGIVNSNETIILWKKSCPYCDRPYQSNQKAVNHIAAIYQKKVERLLSGHRSFGMYRKAHIQKYERLGYSIVVHYGCVSSIKVLFKQTTENTDWRRNFVRYNPMTPGTMRNKSHVIASQPENGTITAADDIIKLGQTMTILSFRTSALPKGFTNFAIM
ncbi:hypothetical protein PS6_001090 [Mucor atramentarius]